MGAWLIHIISQGVARTCNGRLIDLFRYPYVYVVLLNSIVKIFKQSEQLWLDRFCVSLAVDFDFYWDDVFPTSREQLHSMIWGSKVVQTFCIKSYPSLNVPESKVSVRSRKPTECERKSRSVPLENHKLSHRSVSLSCLHHQRAEHIKFSGTE